MRTYMLTFISDDVEKMRVFGALLDAGLKEFVITETEQLTYENWKQTVSENAQVEKICANCIHDYNGHCEVKPWLHSYKDSCECFAERTVSKRK